MKHYLLLLSAATLAATTNANIIHHAKHITGKVVNTTGKIGGKVAQEVGHQVVEHHDEIIKVAADATMDYIVPNIPYANVAIPVVTEILDVVSKKSTWVTSYEQVAFKTGFWEKIKHHWKHNDKEDSDNVIDQHLDEKRNKKTSWSSLLIQVAP